MADNQDSGRDEPVLNYSSPRNETAGGRRECVAARVSLLLAGLCVLLPILGLTLQSEVLLLSVPVAAIGAVIAGVIGLGTTARYQLGGRRKAIIGLAGGGAILFVIMFSMVWQPFRPSRERANRVRCASNLSQIGRALLMYANDNKGAFPRVVHQPGLPPAYFTGSTGTGPFGNSIGAVAPNDVTAAWYLLCRTQDMALEVFTCPSTDDDKDPKTPTGNNWNFDGPKHLSYGLANPYPDPAAESAGYKLTGKLSASFAVAADQGCGISGNNDNCYEPANSANVKRANSYNHAKEGQNVLFGDGHVEWCATAYRGENGDNIYTRQGALSGDPNTMSPAGPGDSLIVPTDDLK